MNSNKIPIYSIFYLLKGDYSYVYVMQLRWDPEIDLDFGLWV